MGGGTTGTVPAGNDSANHGDLAIYSLTDFGKSATGSIWVGDNEGRNVISREAPAVGDPICRSGTTTWQLCGLTIGNVNTTVNSSAGPLKTVDLAYISGTTSCAEGGDSGGPVYRRLAGSDAVAVGIISATFTLPGYGCQLVFTGVEEAVQAWGGNVKFQ